ncbi:uncharacterized protein LOC131552985 [Onychostoma macrolepis]|uniref:uncharacterized protein LOC131552985 n=1 Tax=Onychostoma macrolepis TaxID=369639 RepID=UPI00272B7B9D|nr:uncharacterized protein LOC131552985 [Onychostoma macrolepis]
MKHKTANRIIIHVGKNDIRKEQSELLNTRTATGGFCQSIRAQWHTHTPGQNMSDHGTSCQPQGHLVVDTSHKDTDNTTQTKQAFLMETIPAEPCPKSSSQTDRYVLQQLQDSAPKDNYLENSQGSQDNILQPPETPEPEPRSPDTLSLSPESPLLSFSQKMEELVYAGTKLSHSFAASPQISTKNGGPHNCQRLQAQISLPLLCELSNRCHNTRAQTLLHRL